MLKALAKVGYSAVRQRGSHIRLICVGKNSITVPNHKVVGRGLLKKILRDADLSVEEFVGLL
ncbi:MAG TPA: type II toxin-antitoxin system HicA family toxin [Terriglobia bacterium]|nr:type II toxin-antitoxin system HicA family toxin [Terriglobia bacterium]